MKIGVLVHEIQDYGGIITYIERLMKGFKDLGHDAKLIQLCYQEKVANGHVKPSAEWNTGNAGVLVHSIRGWSFRTSNKIAYKGSYNLKRAIDQLNTFDLLIWAMPSPGLPVSASRRENTSWLELFSSTAKQIMIIHDGNLYKMYPHVIYGLQKAKGRISLSAPHPRGYKACEALGLDRSFIMIPQDDIDQQGMTLHAKRRRGFMACQIFKAWKHVDEPVRAISYMRGKGKEMERIIAGTGMHYYYMTSEEKCQYFHPDDAPKHLAGKRIWDTALANGMHYAGPLTFKERDNLLGQQMIFLDPSYVLDDKGCHMNGAIAEAIRMGCVPLAKHLCLQSDLDKTDKLSPYVPGKNYLVIDQNATDVEYAQALEEYSNLGRQTWLDMNAANIDMVNTHFNYRVVAQQFIDQANGKRAGVVFGKGSGKVAAELVQPAIDMMKTHGVEVGAI